LSVQTRQGPRHHLRLGEALAPLRREGVLVIGSGAFTHDLGRLRRQDRDAAAAEPDVTAFAEWMWAALSTGRVDDVLDYRRRAPFGAAQHPTEEHLLPLFVALGAGGTDAPVRRLHASTDYGVLRMDAFAFGETA
jgi:4,5-DOPA dioxygenase extradiol